MRFDFSVRFQIAAMLYMVVQAVFFGAGLVAVLATPLTHNALIALPIMTVASFVLAVPVAWIVAVRLETRYWREKKRAGDLISG